MGSASHDLLDALFDVDVGDDQFNDFDSEDIPPTPEVKASEPLNDVHSDAAPATPRRGRYAPGTNVAASPGLPRRSRSRNGAFLTLPAVSSPLAQLFTAGLRQSWGPMSAVSQDDLTTSVRRVEGMLEGMPEAEKMKADLRDTKERLERIETLLQSLVRGSRS